MSRRSLPKQIERVQYDARAAHASCGTCPLHAKGCQPVKPRGGTGPLVVINEYPSAYEDKHGQHLTSAQSHLLDKTIANAGAPDYVSTWTLLCRPPKDTTDAELREAIQACAPRLQHELETVKASFGVGERKSIGLLSLGALSLQGLGGRTNLDKWVGSVSETADGTIYIPTWDPGFVLTKSGLRYGGIWSRHVRRAVDGAHGLLEPFDTGEDVVDECDKTLEKIAEEAVSGAEVAVDIETRGLGLDSEISCIGFATATSSCCIQLLAAEESDLLVRKILAHGVMVGQNISAFDRQVLQRAGYQLTPHYEDTMLAASILDPQLPKNLGFLAASEFASTAWKAAFKADAETGVMMGEWDSTDPAVERERRKYCRLDTLFTFHLWQVQKRRLAEYGFQFYQELKELSQIALELRRTGIVWDTEAAARLEAKYMEKQKKAEEHLQKGADALGWRRPRTNAEGKDITRKAPLNPGSTAQLAELFYNEMKIAPSVWTESGKPSTNDNALMSIIVSVDNPTAVAFAKKVTDYRDAVKALGTYIRGMAPGAQLGTKADPGIDIDYGFDRRVHGAWRADTAPTGRWSCTGRGFQTLNAEMRQLLTVEPGNLAVEADLPSAEVRTVMLFAGQDDIIDLLNDGGDLYSGAATKIFGKPVSKKENKHLRQLGKLVILASHYGATEATVFFQIWKDLIDPADPESKTVIETFPDLAPKKIGAIQNLYFRDTAPKVKQWMLDETAASAARGYYLSPLSGRKVKFFGPADLNFACNYPNQETVAWWMNNALRRIRPQMQPQDKLLTFIHDSLTAETIAAEIDRLKDLFVREMEGEIEYRGRRVLMKPVEWKIGPNLAAVK